MTCQLLLAYEDLDTARHAQENYQRILKPLGDPANVNSSLWKFNLLQNPKLCDLAAHEASVSDIIIISTHGDRELPSEVRDWLELTVGQRLSNPPCTLVPLFDRYDNYYGRAIICDYLEEIAKRGHFEFLPDLTDFEAA